MCRIFLKESPSVVERIGLDLHVNDLHNEEDYLWLRALIWPEHKERLEMFDVCIFSENESVQLIEGDGVELLSSIIEQISEEAVICIFHTHVANQIPEQVKHKLEKQIQEIGANVMYSTCITTCGIVTFILIIILTETNIVKRLEKQKGMGDGLAGRLEMRRLFRLIGAPSLVKDGAIGSSID